MKNEKKKGRKLQIAAAAVGTVILFSALPISAWFHQQREIARFQNIKAPDLLYLTAAHREQAKLLEIDTIDVEKYDTMTVSGSPTQVRRVYKDYVFCVAGEYVSSFTLQIAHTTNNPFIFEVYNATPSLESVPGSIAGRDYSYIAQDLYDNSELESIAEHPILRDGQQSTVQEGDLVYYTAGTKIDGAYINRSISEPAAGETRPYADYITPANNSYELKSYDSGDLVQINAEPAYWQKTGLRTKAEDDGQATTIGSIAREPFYREFVLRIIWPDDEQVINNKETDIIYITAKGS